MVVQSCALLVLPLFLVVVVVVVVVAILLVRVGRCFGAFGCIGFVP